MGAEPSPVGAEPSTPPVMERQSGVVAPTFCGWLHKQGGRVKSWKKRWFNLENGILTYRAKEGQASELGSIDLSKYTTLDFVDLSEKNKTNGFTIAGPDQRTFVFVAAKSDLRLQWGEVLVAAGLTADERVAQRLAVFGLKHLFLEQCADIPGAYDIKVSREPQAFPPSIETSTIVRARAVIRETGIKGVLVMDGKSVTLTVGDSTESYSFRSIKALKFDHPVRTFRFVATRPTGGPDADVSLIFLSSIQSTYVETHITRCIGAILAQK